MDNLTRRIAGFASELKYNQLPQSAVAAATRFIVDSLACAIAARDCESAQMGLRLARGAAPDAFQDESFATASVQAPRARRS